MSSPNPRHQMWLDDPITVELLNHLTREVKTKTQLIFDSRRTNPSSLPDSVAALELATALKSTIETGKFLN